MTKSLRKKWGPTRVSKPWPAEYQSSNASDWTSWPSKCDLHPVNYVLHDSVTLPYEPQDDKTNKMTCAPSEDSDLPEHPPSLIRAFTARMKKPRVLSYPFSAQRWLWSDWADAQADLSLHWTHRSICWFCHAAAHIFVSVNVSLQSLKVSLQCVLVSIWFESLMATTHFILLPIHFVKKPWENSIELLYLKRNTLKILP